MWPEIQRLADEQIVQHMGDGREVVVLDAAVLLAAGWHKTMCHQVWCCVVNQEEALKRIMKRDGKTAQEAKERLASQQSNLEIMSECNVVFCTQWEEAFTVDQVDKAWRELERRLETGQRTKVFRPRWHRDFQEEKKENVDAFEVVALKHYAPEENKPSNTCTCL